MEVGLQGEALQGRRCHRAVPEPFLPFPFPVSCSFMHSPRLSTQRDLPSLLRTFLSNSFFGSARNAKDLRTEWNSNRNTIVT